MPKEVVQGCLDYEQGGPLGLQVEVGWHRAPTGTVQVSTVLRNNSDHAYVEREVNGGWFVDLDRVGLNQLIRNLRRARDQAFGRDE